MIKTINKYSDWLLAAILVQLLRVVEPEHWLNGGVCLLLLILITAGAAGLAADRDTCSAIHGTLLLRRVRGDGAGAIRGTRDTHA